MRRLREEDTYKPIRSRNLYNLGTVPILLPNFFSNKLITCIHLLFADESFIQHFRETGRRLLCHIYNAGYVEFSTFKEKARPRNLCALIVSKAEYSFMFLKRTFRPCYRL